jgi:hypothetical protein
MLSPTETNFTQRELIDECQSSSLSGTVTTILDAALSCYLGESEGNSVSGLLNFLNMVIVNNLNIRLDWQLTRRSKQFLALLMLIDEPFLRFALF